ncbi:hypothetical protein MTBBW1_350041 [Desulfamplus magnetovallimortis]|uniref:DUF342 domain-containing protein n=1 Tax=Desulfamplus magnetovallimortis TaxID=1246637 RepID=A0A1W1HGF8_9BACT|nr:hypothetical protein [Desulfamplus magnetovallimortis]SLM31550.1 hypothetical protein MTBBW1_350041 [Desulfamplus magnetovallimortis]
MQQKRDKLADHLLSRYHYNSRKLRILLEKNLISRAQFSNIKSTLDKELKNKKQTELEPLLESVFSSPIPEKLYQILNKELFKYHQIIIKLAQQFSKNLTLQQLNLLKKDKHFIRQSTLLLQKTFSEILKNLTNEYLEGVQNNIDDKLIESGFIKGAHLEFLHNSALHLEIKVQDRKFGKIAVSNNFTTQEIVNNALDEQTKRYRKTKQNHIIGDILVEKNQITPEVRDEILIIQNRVLEEDWEETLKNAGQSSIEEKEKNAMFGALVIKEKLMDEKKVIEALKVQAKEESIYLKRQGNKDIFPVSSVNALNAHQQGENLPADNKPRWIGDILVQDFGLSDKDRKRIVKKQMAYRIERINLKLGLNISDAHSELFNEMEKYFSITYSNDRIEAWIKLTRPLPESMTKENIIIWLYHKKITYGRIPDIVDDLISKRVKPGKKVLLAKGDFPVPPDAVAQFHFPLQDHNISENLKANNKPPLNGVIPTLVQRGTNLVTIHTRRGKSGINVNRCFVPPPLKTPQSITPGKNVVKKQNNVLMASCDGSPILSPQNILSINPDVSIKGDVTVENSPVIFDCNFEIDGTVETGVEVQCRSLKTNTLKGKAINSEEVIVMHEAINAEIISKGTITLSSVEKSLIIGEKNITVQLNTPKKPSDFNRIYDTEINGGDTVKINDAKIIGSVIRAKKRIILKNVIVGNRCSFIAGDSVEATASKKTLESLNNKINKIDAKIKLLQKSSQALFAKIEKKDIAAIDEEIKICSRQLRTKADLDRLAKLRVTKRKKEREYEINIDEYGTIFMKNSAIIKAHQEKKNTLEADRNEIKKQITDYYSSDHESPEIDARRTLMPAGTVLQFRFCRQVLDSDCEGVIFREGINHKTRQYEIKRHKW